MHPPYGHQYYEQWGKSEALSDGTIAYVVIHLIENIFSLTSCFLDSVFETQSPKFLNVSFAEVHVECICQEVPIIGETDMSLTGRVLDDTKASIQVAI